MNASAALRTPVEIWWYILKLAVETRYQIYDTNSIIEDFRLFDTSCEPYRVLHAAEKTTLNLRLVCRSWNAFLSATPGYWVSDAEGRQLSSRSVASGKAYRAHLTSFINCTSCSKSCEVKKRWDPENKAENVAATISASYPNLQVLIVSSSQECGHKLLEASKSSLRVLLWTSTLDFPMTSLVIQRSLHGITHLRLTNIGSEDLELLGCGVVFPEVQMLWLDIYIDGENGDFILSTWKIPKLRRLRLFGYCCGDFGDDMFRFMVAHAPMITELVLRFNLITSAGNEVAWTIFDDFGTHSHDFPCWDPVGSTSRMFPLHPIPMRVDLPSF